MASTIPAPLAGKVAIVTGASQGIGEAVVLEFARQGCSHIALTYHSRRDLAEDVVARTHQISESIKVAAFPADVCSPTCGRDVVANALKQLEVDHIDILVSNAGVQSPDALKAAIDVTLEDINTYMCAQAWTPLSLAQSVYPYMGEGGRIVMCSSGAGKKAFGDPLLLHSMSKAAMDSVARNLGAQWGKEKGITVNSIGVGSTDTESLRRSTSGNPKIKEHAERNSVLGRIGSAAEVANIISFVCSPGASWICANQIPANGGSMPMLQG